MPNHLVRQDGMSLHPRALPAQICGAAAVASADLIAHVNVRRCAAGRTIARRSMRAMSGSGVPVSCSGECTCQVSPHFHDLAGPSRRHLDDERRSTVGGT